MSLVGTRPPTVDEWDKYELHHRARLATKPGLTGMWQVSGRSNITDFEEVVKLDKQYISEWTMGLDIKILLKAFQVIDEEELAKYKIDCCIVGSDEIWNIRVAQFQNPIFYGKFNAKSMPCLAYAPSAGQAEKQDFDNFPEIIELFNRISIIGVRDLNTASIVHKILKRKVPLVCDPTCLLEIDKFMFPKVDIGIDKYILVYSYSVPKEHQQFIKRYAKHYKYSVSDGRYKIYNHKLYKLLLTDPPESMRDDIFEIDGTKYLWMLFEELEVDLNTMQKNDDVIAFVKSKI